MFFNSYLKNTGGGMNAECVLGLKTTNELGLCCLLWQKLHLCTYIYIQIN